MQNSMNIQKTISHLMTFLVLSHDTISSFISYLIHNSIRSWVISSLSTCFVVFFFNLIDENNSQSDIANKRKKITKTKQFISLFDLSFAINEA
jgi:hypothetical protein